MPYLSRIWINPLRRQGSRLLSNPQAMRAAVLGGLPTQPVEERVLWRVDADNPRRPALLVVTRSSPSWEHVVEQAGWPSSEESDEPQAVTKPYDPLLARVVEGEEFAFRLTANPVQATKSPEKLTDSQRERFSGGQPPRSIRVGHRTACHQLSWLLERTGQWGFEVPPSRSPSENDESGASDVRIAARSRRTFVRGGSSGGRGQRVTLQVVTYEGRLVVTDAEQLRERLVAGIGPAKAYGCGLLTLAPLPHGRGDAG